MRSIFVFLVIYFFFIISVCGQVTTISGRVLDASSGEYLIGANIILASPNQVFSSNEYGFYQVKLWGQSDSVRLMVSYVGFQTIDTIIFVTENQIKLDFAMYGMSYLDEVSIRADPFQVFNQKEGLGSIKMYSEQIDKIPRLGGESDLMKAFQLLPGVQAGNEGSSDIIVRGGSQDQNLIILDDVPLYYVNHLGGFVSVFNTDAINSVKLYKGGFPSRFGNRLSSVMDIKMKEGNNQTRSGSATVGLISSKILLEGPIRNSKTSYMISARRFMYDLFTRPLSRLLFGGTSTGYTFYDFNFKINHELSEKSHLYLSAYFGKDAITLSYRDDQNKSKFKQSWGNDLISLRWNKIHNNQHFSNLTFYYTKYRYDNEISYDQSIGNSVKKVNNKFSSGIQDIGLKMDTEFNLRSYLSVETGFNSIIHIFQPQRFRIQEFEQTNVSDSVYGNAQFHAFENSVYTESKFSIRDKIQGRIGFRGVSYTVPEKTFIYGEPRLSFSYELNPNVQIQAAYTMMHQNVHMVSSTGVGFPIDLWLPATETLGPSRAEQISLGFTNELLNFPFSWGLETFYKRFSNLVMPKVGTGFYSAGGSWQNKLEGNGIGDAYGIELFVEKKFGVNTGWLSYTLSRSNRQFENINLGRAFPFRFDRRHEINLVYSREIKKNIDFTSTWTFGSGLPITLPVAHYQVPNDRENQETIFIYDGINSSRMRAFHRLDVGINFKKMKPKGERIWNISIFNLYNRQNPYFYFYKTSNQNGNVSYRLAQQSLFPIMPSFSYSFKF